MNLPSECRIWLVAGVTDMRKSFNGLGEQVQSVLNEKPPLRSYLYLPGPERRYGKGALGR